jgi:23S rRNA (pseudouridine1915-N3)-methyltransferase
MKLRIVSFGHRRDDLQPLLDDYAGRLVRPWSLDFIDHPSARKSEHESAAEVMAREAAKVSGTYWALCASSKAPSSEELARMLGQAADSRRELTFVIGGADGLDPSVVRGAERQLSLSALTLPHRLARLVLVEQIYRAQAILRGTRYHK